MIHPIEKARELVEEHPETIVCRNRIKKWAHENAYTLIFIAIISMIGWAVSIAAAIYIVVSLGDK